MSQRQTAQCGGNVDSCAWVIEAFRLLSASSSTKSLSVAMPDTVAYKFQRPIAWFQFNPINSSVSRLTDHLSASEIHAQLTDTDADAAASAATTHANTSAPTTATATSATTATSMATTTSTPSTSSTTISSSASRVVAYYVSERSDESGLNPTIEYFDAVTLREFLTKRVADNGILQQFRKGSNEKHNTLLRVLWTPYISSIESCSNKNSMHDTKLSPVSRAATFDAPVHLVDTHTVRGSALATRVLKSVHEIVQHISSQHFSHEVASIVLFFKVMPRGKIFFLWCQSMKLQPRILLALPACTSAQGSSKRRSGLHARAASTTQSKSPASSALASALPSARDHTDEAAGGTDGTAATPARGGRGLSTSGSLRTLPQTAISAAHSHELACSPDAARRNKQSLSRSLPGSYKSGALTPSISAASKHHYRASYWVADAPGGSNGTDGLYAMTSAFATDGLFRRPATSSLPISSRIGHAAGSNSSPMLDLLPRASCSSPHASPPFTHHSAASPSADVAPRTSHHALRAAADGSYRSRQADQLGPRAGRRLRGSASDAVLSPYSQRPLTSPMQTPMSTSPALLRTDQSKRGNSNDAANSAANSVNAQTAAAGKRGCCTSTPAMGLTSSPSMSRHKHPSGRLAANRALQAGPASTHVTSLPGLSPTILGPAETSPDARRANTRDDRQNGGSSALTQLLEQQHKMLEAFSQENEHIQKRLSDLQKQCSVPTSVEALAGTVLL